MSMNIVTECNAFGNLIACLLQLNEIKLAKSLYCM